MNPKCSMSNSSSSKEIPTAAYIKSREELVVEIRDGVITFPLGYGRDELELLEMLGADPFRVSPLCG